METDQMITFPPMVPSVSMRFKALLKLRVCHHDLKLFPSPGGPANDNYRGPFKLINECCAHWGLLLFWSKLGLNVSFRSENLCVQVLESFRPKNISNG